MMRKTSFFARSFVSYAAILLVALLIAGAVFLRQIGMYSLQEKKEQIKQTANTVAEQTVTVLENYSTQIDTLYQISLIRMARDVQVEIMITDPDGNICIAADDSAVSVDHGGQVATSIVRQISTMGYYGEIGTLGNILPDTNYVVGTRCVDSQGNVCALVFVNMNLQTTVGILSHVSRIFVIIVASALIGILIMTYMTSARMTRPLKTMAGAARAFANGDFSVRVPQDNHCQEIDELAGSFNHMASGLEQLEELTRGFIGNVSHEFKTPMTTIGGFVDGMLDGTIPQEQHEKYLHVISEEVHRLSRMVVRMLDTAKIQSGELLLTPAPFDFSEMASQIILSFEQKIDAKHVEVEVEFDDQMMVMGDRDHVFRAVYNLVDNAVKFVDEGGRLALHAHTAQNMGEFSIANTGGGIAPEDLSHIFDRFYKADPSRSRDRTGAGLGLYIVKNIINLHGGDISVRSSGGETEFSFTLPLAPRQKPNSRVADTEDAEFTNNS